MIENNEKKYSKSEVLKSTLEYFKGDEFATDAWINKYCLKDDKYYYELNPDDMHRRIAKELARIESKYPNALSEDDIYETLKNFKRIIPAGSPMSGIGNNKQTVSLGNCFVIGYDGDSYGTIVKLDEEQAQLMKRRGGVGHDLSNIRPATTPVNNSALTSTGIVPFMERYSNTTKEVAQDGRRGALMLSISIKHPDAESFIDAKLTQGKITGANISVKIDDEFMNCVINNKPYIHRYPINIDFTLDSGIREEDMEFNKLYKGALGYYKKINAQKLWKKIIYNAWKSAEPGILFWDNILNESIPSCYGKDFIEKSTNPCGELPLNPYDSCRLLSINLYSYVDNPFKTNSSFNWNLFKEDVKKGMRYMDDIIDLEIEKIDSILAKIEKDPEDDHLKAVEKNLWIKIKNNAKNGRRSGLGVTAVGDMLAALNLIYGTDNANDFIEEVFKVFKHSAYKSSIEMAKERGVFPLYDSNKEINNPFINRIKSEDLELYNEMVKYGRRNIALLTIAPTGTLSTMTQTTSGIESVFLPVYKRRRKINPNEKDIKIDFVDDEGIAWQEYLIFHHKFNDYLINNGYDLKVAKTMNENQIDELVKKSPYYKATSNDVDWVKKVEMQGRIQKHIDHSISVTVNLPKDVTEEIVDKVYTSGWKHGCKGITVYRDGSRSGVLVNVNDNKNNDVFHENHAPKRPKRLKAEIHRFQNNLEKWIAVVGLKDGRPYEIFTGKLENGLSYLPSNITNCEVVKNIFEVEEIDSEGQKVKVKKKRYDIEYIDSNGEKQVHTGLNHAFNPEFWNYAKFISAVLRHGMPLVYVYELIDSLNFKDEHINTWKNGVERIVKKYIKDGEKIKGLCPVCKGTEFIFQEGCVRCAGCGWSKCS